VSKQSALNFTEGNCDLCHTHAAKEELLSMKVGLLGSGNVGQALAKGFINAKHQVYMAMRDPEGEKAQGLKRALPSGTVCDFRTAAQEGELLVLCTPWDAAEDVIKQAGADNLKSKVLIDTINPISRGESGVSVAPSVENSAGEAVQQWLPESKVVKCFNSVGADCMYMPEFPLEPTMFYCGNDTDAKRQVSDIVALFGWEPFDAGDITAARELESLAVLWINNAMRTGERGHAFKML
jgi:predicted dinucleotide-binding enzyme